jgi:HSP20 family protein
MTENNNPTKEMHKKTLQAKDKAIEVKKGALEKTAEAKDKALMKTSEIKESASDKTAEIKEGAAIKTSEFKENAENKRKQAENMFNEFISTLKDKQEDFGKAITDYTSSEKPLVDIINTEDTIILKADLPNVKKEDVTVNITENSVEIMAKFDDADENITFINKERNYGKINRILALPEMIDVKKVSAKFLNGVLTVELPKVQEEKIRVDIS